MSVDLALALTLWTADYLQTRTVARHPAAYYESGGTVFHLMGSHPSESRVNQYFGAGMVAIAVSYEVLPKPWNHVAMGLVIGSEALQVRHNLLLGVKFSF